MIYARFSHPTWGYSYDQEQCQVNGLIAGKSYEMAYISVGRNSSKVFLEEFGSIAFNSVHFDFYQIIAGNECPVDVYQRFDSSYY